jgi:hypothetical protein
MLKIGDYVIILVIVVISVSMGYFSYFSNVSSNENVQAQLIYNGDVIKVIDLGAITNNEINKVNYNEYGIEIEARHNGIRISDSDCQDKLCIMASWVDKSGEMSICLPQKFMIKIIGSSLEEIDTTAY